MMIFIILSIVLIPVIINFISSYQICADKDIVAGNESDWVGFFGSYSGALLGAMITLYVVWRESKVNALNIMIQKKERSIEDLRAQLAERLNAFDFCYLGSISLHGSCLTPETITDYLIVINEKHQNATSLYNAWSILLSDNKYADYNSVYDTCYDTYVGCIDELTKILASYRTKEKSLTDLMNDLTKYNDDLRQVKRECLKLLQEESLRIIKVEEKKMNNMVEQLSKWVPRITV